MKNSHGFCLSGVFILSLVLREGGRQFGVSVPPTCSSLSRVPVHLRHMAKTFVQSPRQTPRPTGDPGSLLGESDWEVLIPLTSVCPRE